jgi:hypothetical protein
MPPSDLDKILPPFLTPEGCAGIVSAMPGTLSEHLGCGSSLNVKPRTKDGHPGQCFETGRLLVFSISMKKHHTRIGKTDL